MESYGNEIRVQQGEDWNLDTLLSASTHFETKSTILSLYSIRLSLYLDIPFCGLYT